jgi:hypothetical protein
LANIEYWAMGLYTILTKVRFIPFPTPQEHHPEQHMYQAGWQNQILTTLEIYRITW